MWEWVLDWYDANWYSGGGKTCIDCANLNTTSGRVMRGGSIYSDGFFLRAGSRLYYDPTERHIKLGFRCARDA